MEWLGGGFVLTVGGVRLRVRIALEDAPCDDAQRPAPRAVEPRDDPRPAPHRVHHPR
jgi:hypothetical protein